MRAASLLAVLVLAALSAANCQAALVFERQCYKESYHTSHSGPPSLIGRVRFADGGVPQATWDIPRFTAADEGTIWTLSAETPPSYDDWRDFVGWGLSWPSELGLQSVNWGLSNAFPPPLSSSLHRVTATGYGGVWHIDRLTFTLDRFDQRLAPEKFAELGEGAMYYEALATIRIFTVAPEPSALLLVAISVCGLATTWRRRG